MRGHYERKKQKPKRTLGGKKVVLIVIAVILVLIVAALIAGIVYYNTMLNKINRVEVPKIVYTRPTTEATENTGETASAETTEEATVATEPHVASSADYLNILVVGQAARDGEAERFADTAILCTINTYTKTLTMTSLLRDTLVQMPNFRGKEGGKIKLTVIYHLGSYYSNGDIAGSMELMNMTLFNNFGIEVDHNFEIDFEAFVKVVNMIGGIDIELTEAEADYLNADGKVWQEVEPGVNWLDGDTALAYARMRKASGDNESDIVRTERQRKFIETMLAKLKTMSLSELQTMANEVLPMVTTSMSNAEITDCLLTLLPMLPELTIERGGTCPADYWGDMVEIYGDGVYHSVLRFDQAETIKTMRAITEGEEP
ncbi:MAG: LCP family protein [Lachnospiraceae bacterium]